MKKFLITTVIIFSCFVSFAQVPGYMGKRLYGGLRFNFSPVINEEFAKNDSSGFEMLYFAYRGLNKRFELHADYVLSQRKSVGGSIAFHNPYFRTYSSSGPERLVKLKTTKIAAYLQWGKKDGVPAPVGRFFRWELGLYMFKAKDPVNPDAYKAGIAPATFMTFGRNYVVSDIILFNWGLQYGLTWIRPWGLDQPENLYEKERLLSSGAFNIEVGMGFLIK